LSKSLRLLLVILGYGLMVPGIVLALPGALLLYLCGVRSPGRIRTLESVAWEIMSERENRRLRAYEHRN
jgi:hypothetical protein